LALQERRFAPIRLAKAMRHDKAGFPPAIYTSFTLVEHETIAQEIEKLI
jgi:hypothetical protein